ncbi:hypothetical protein FHW13_001156 [Dokdonella fugitiva]|nr:hypothetical protein [Dokdonella fugitiva]
MAPVEKDRSKCIMEGSVCVRDVAGERSKSPPDRQRAESFPAGPLWEPLRAAAPLRSKQLLPHCSRGSDPRPCSLAESTTNGASFRRCCEYEWFVGGYGLLCWLLPGNLLALNTTLAGGVPCAWRAPTNGAQCILCKIHPVPRYARRRVLQQRSSPLDPVRAPPFHRTGGHHAPEIPSGRATGSRPACRTTAVAILSGPHISASAGALASTGSSDAMMVQGA